jgi:hypothetical protein
MMRVRVMGIDGNGWIGFLVLELRYLPDLRKRRRLRELRYEGF